MEIKNYDASHLEKGRFYSLEVIINDSKRKEFLYIINKEVNGDIEEYELLRVITPELENLSTISIEKVKNDMFDSNSDLNMYWKMYGHEIDEKQFLTGYLVAKSRIDLLMCDLL